MEYLQNCLYINLEHCSVNYSEYMMDIEKKWLNKPKKC